MESSGKTKLDIATLLGLVLAFGGIVGGLILEKGDIKDIAQLTAAIIVLGGTAGAVLVNTPLRTVLAAVAHLKLVFFETDRNPTEIVDKIIVFAGKARKQGIVSLESDANAISDPFMKKAINLAVDGTDLEEMRLMMELEIDNYEHHIEEIAKVFDSAGGYAPTIGIIGAVLGLIQVMKNLANIEEVGHGIAVAFVATVYGVALANIVMLPAAAKIRSRSARERHLREMALEGVLGIIEGWNPKLIRSKLEAFLYGKDASRIKKAGGSSRAA